MQTETIHTQQESIYQQNLSTERQTLLFVDSDSEIELTDIELAFIHGGQAELGGDPIRHIPPPPQCPLLGSLLSICK